MTTLFDPITVGAIEAPNRIMMAPLTRGRATRNHVPTPLMGEYYGQRASAGLIISVKARRAQRAERQDVLHTGTRGIDGLFGVNVDYGDRHSRRPLGRGRHKDVAMSVFTLNALLSVGSLAVGVPRIADAAGRFSCVDRRPFPASARPSPRCAQWRITP